MVDGSDLISITQTIKRFVASLLSKTLHANSSGIALCCCGIQTHSGSELQCCNCSCNSWIRIKHEMQSGQKQLHSCVLKLRVLRNVWGNHGYQMKYAYQFEILSKGNLLKRKNYHSLTAGGYSVFEPLCFGRGCA